MTTRNEYMIFIKNDTKDTIKSSTDLELMIMRPIEQYALSNIKIIIKI